MSSDVILIRHSMPRAFLVALACVLARAVAAATPIVVTDAATAPAGLDGVGRDAASRARLRCNACVVAVDAIYDDVEGERARRGGRVTLELAVDVMERTCARVGREFGLQMRDDRVTEMFSDDATVARARGRWITTYVSEACGTLIDGEHDEAWVELVNGGGNRRREVMCFERNRVCESAEAAKNANSARGAPGRDEL